MIPLYLLQLLYTFIMATITVMLAIKCWSLKTPLTTASTSVPNHKSIQPKKTKKVLSSPKTRPRPTQHHHHLGISELNDKLLSKILLHKDIPLQHRIISLRNVSTQWKRLIDENLQKQTTLCINYHEQSNRPKLINLDNVDFTVHFVEQLQILVPHITNLSLITYTQATYQLLTKILKHYRHCLTKLTIGGRLIGPSDNQVQSFQATQRLITALNALPRLTHLRILYYTINRQQIQHLAPTLSRLNTCVFEGSLCGRNWHHEELHATLRTLLPIHCICLLAVDDSTLDWSSKKKKKRYELLTHSLSLMAHIRAAEVLKREFNIIVNSW